MVVLLLAQAHTWTYRAASGARSPRQNPIEAGQRPTRPARQGGKHLSGGQSSHSTPGPLHASLALFAQRAHPSIHSRYTSAMTAARTRAYAAPIIPMSGTKIIATRPNVTSATTSPPAVRPGRPAACRKTTRILRSERRKPATIRTRAASIAPAKSAPNASGNNQPTIASANNAAAPAIQTAFTAVRRTMWRRTFKSISDVIRVNATVPYAFISIVGRLSKAAATTYRPSSCRGRSSPTTVWSSDRDSRGAFAAGRAASP